MRHVDGECDDEKSQGTSAVRLYVRRDRLRPGNRNTPSLFLDLTKSFLKEPESKTIDLGSTAQFYCLNSGSLPLADIYWLRDGQPISSSLLVVTIPAALSRTTSTLVISNATKNDEGEYGCVAMNSETGESVFSKTGTLTVNAPDAVPQFVESLTDQVVVEGSSILIPCKVRGNPHPTISWQIAGDDANKSSTTIFPNGSIFVSDVTLMKSQLNVSYRCVASNRAGTATSPYITVKAACKWVEDRVSGSFIT